MEGFKDTFGPQSRRKRPTIGTTSLAEMLMQANDNKNEYNEENDKDLHKFDILDTKE